MSFLRRWHTARPHLIGALCALHVVACLVLALPNPKIGMDRRAWSDERATREFDSWARTFHTDRQVLEDTLFELGKLAMSIHGALDAPFQPYIKVSGLKQRWSMFTAGTPFADAYQLRGRLPDGSWLPLYDQALGARHLAHLIENPRVRSVVSSCSWPHNARRNKKLCAIYARRLFASSDESLRALNAIECSFVRSDLRDPNNPSAVLRAPKRFGIVLVERGDFGAAEPAAGGAP
jgi:hypothetical protein